ncbi:MAG: O-antigen ligase family protein [Proteobacteria bacterium]|nr:O-antigen ligase family protein [Pseudomonadota bacterium]
MIDVLFLGLLFFLFLIIVRPQDFVPAFMGERIVFYVMAVLLMTWLLSDTKKELFRTQLDKFVAFFLIWCCVSTISTHWIDYIVSTSLEQLKLLLIYFFTVTVINSKYRFNIGILIILGCMLCVATMGVLQAHGIDLTRAGMLWAPDKQIWQIRGAGNFDNPNDLAYSVVLIVPFALGMMIKGPGLITRFISSGALAMTFYCIYLTKSRGGLLALATCLAFWLLAWARRPVWKRAAIVFCTVGVIVAFVAQSEGYRDDRSSMGRVEAWSAGSKMLRDHPLLGVGKGQFREYYKRDSHNSYVRAGAETGLVGLYAFVGILFTLFHFLKRPEYTSSTGEMRVYHSGFVGFFSSYAVGSIFSTRTYDIVFLVMAALLGASIRLDFPESERSRGKLWNRDVLIATVIVVVSWKVFLSQVW